VAKGVFRLGRCYILRQGCSRSLGLQTGRLGYQGL